MFCMFSGALRGVPAGWGSGKIKNGGRIENATAVFCFVAQGGAPPYQFFSAEVMRFGRFLQLQQGF